MEPENNKPDKAPRGKGHIAVNILLGASILGLLGAALGFVLSTKEYRVASKEYDDLAKSYAQPAAEEKETGKQIDFAALRQINPELVGWLDIPGTKVSYPVAQDADNSYYISHTFEKTYNPSGAIFLDAAASGDMSGTNNIFYGHNMKDGSMFATVQNYCTTPSFRTEHPDIYFYTEEATLVYSVFALRQTTIQDAAYQTQFGNEQAKTTFLQEMDPSLSAGDQIITLSTCVNDGNPETPHRYIVQAVLRETLPPATGIPLPGSGA